jgi:hypothetical protein
MAMDDFQFLLRDLARAFREDALWGGQVISGRFRIDPFEAPVGGIDPGVGETQIWFYCDRAVVPKPWPGMGDHLVIRGQLYEIVQHDEDDIGEFGFRLIRRETDINTVTSEGVYSYDGQPVVQPLVDPVPAVVVSANGRPSRRHEFASAYEQAVTAGTVNPELPVKQQVAVLHQALGPRHGLSAKTMQRVIGQLARDRRAPLTILKPGDGPARGQ